ncbi:MAG: glycosyl hydrolase family 3 [Thermomicrobiales bacterium]|nr:glycosyl hydrolase family 3 [Thermomicrobiales bacterium]
MTTPERLSLSRRSLLAGAVSGGLAMTRFSGMKAQELDVDALVAAMTPRERAARLFMLPVSGTALTAEEESWLRDLKPGGVILVGSNFGTPEEVRTLVAAIHETNPSLPPLVALDQEGGAVSRIADDPAPGAPAMGLLPDEEIAALARARAEVLAGYGCDVNFAPVADVAFGAGGFMVGRAFGDDPVVVAEDVAAYVAGVAGSGVLHCVKHFPGHGRVGVDSHEALPVLDVDPERWWDEDALPFRAAVAAGVPMVMLGHLAVPAWDELPASLSPVAVGVLRDDVGFEGVVVSDDLGMGALGAWGPLEIVDLAVAAGNDLLLHVVPRTSPGQLVAHLEERIESGMISLDRVTQSVERVIRMQLERDQA